MNNPTRSPSAKALSERELIVLRSLAKGRSVKEIAGDLFLSVKTVSVYKIQLFRRLGVNSIAELVRYAISNGLE
jgi:DNA-binding NarL/FixJ family response regulator